MNPQRSVLWWGHFDPEYSRNRIVRAMFAKLGWTVCDFQPVLSRLGDLQARLQRFPRVAAVWVPCFRQRDLLAASRWARAHQLPLIFDPLISAYDKQVDERQKLRPDSRAARRLLAWEKRLFALPDRVIADTSAHASYYHKHLGVPSARIKVLLVGAEDMLFRPCEPQAINAAPEVLFFGSFIPLQGPQVIVEAVRHYSGRPVRWTLLGAGPLRAQCEAIASDLSGVTFENWMPYQNLPRRICDADILLGIFGTTPKAARVVPNKVYQALACARPLITRESPAYPADLMRGTETGIRWVPPGDPAALASEVARLVQQPERLPAMGREALGSSVRYFGLERLEVGLNQLLQELGLR